MCNIDGKNSLKYFLKTLNAVDYSNSVFWLSTILFHKSGTQ